MGPKISIHDCLPLYKKPFSTKNSLMEWFGLGPSNINDCIMSLENGLLIESDVGQMDSASKACLCVSPKNERGKREKSDDQMGRKRIVPKRACDQAVTRL